MTATQSQIRDAIKKRLEMTLDINASGLAEAIMELPEMQSALDTQKPAGDLSVLYEIKDILPNPSQVRDRLNIWLYHNDPKLPHNKG